MEHVRRGSESLDRAWARADRVLVLQRGDGHEALAEIRDTGGLGALRSFTSEGEWVGDVCRCLGDLTLALYQQDDLLGTASLHGDRVSWERERFGSDLVLADAVGLRLFLAERGVRGASGALLSPMLERLGLHEGEVQFRPAQDRAWLVSRRVPAVLHDELAGMAGNEVDRLDQAAVERLWRLLTAGESEPVRRVLGWLGSVTWPAEALSGDGVLARRLLEVSGAGGILGLAAGLGEPAEVMGVLVWSMFQADDTEWVSAVAPALRELCGGR